MAAMATLLASPKLIKQQAVRWLNKPSSAQGRTESLRTRLSCLNDEEKRYTKAYGSGLMSERLYKTEARALMAKRAKLINELSSLEFELNSRPQMSADELASQASKLIKKLDSTDRKFVV